MEDIMLILLLIVHGLSLRVQAHGRMIEPMNRASLWRLGYNFPRNYNDNELNCGGFQVQWLENNGRCGHCGDPFRGPRIHESGGIFANDVITGTYRQGQIINVTIDISANHGGFFMFYLCPSHFLTEGCFRKHPLQVVDEGNMYRLKSWSSPLLVKLQLKLPQDVFCPRCVLQWRWNCGQSYGWNRRTGRYCLGCGAQEQFWNCADIAIHQRESLKTKSRKPTLEHLYSKTTSTRTNSQTQSSESDDTIQTADVILEPGQSESTTQTTRCRGSLTYGQSLNTWCKRNCAVGFCPPSHCVCS